MSTLYTEIIQDAYRRPLHRGEIDQPTHQHEEENSLCGDVLRIELKVEDGIIEEARFQGRGCVISQAAAELLLDQIDHQPLSVIQTLNRETVLAELGLPTISPARLKCALLGLEVLRAMV